MGKGRALILPEQAREAELWLPQGVTVVGSRQHGGGVELTLQGSAIDDDCGYQLVTTQTKMSRTVELVKNPQQIDPVVDPEKDALIAENATLKAEVAKMDPDGDGKVGGKRKKATASA